jgi:hypothetical protein
MKTSRKNTILFGLYGFIAVSLFFLFLKLFGLENVTELRLFNIVILVVMTNMLARKNVHSLKEFNYVEGLASLIGANFITALLSTLGFLIYIKGFNQDLLSSFKNHYIADGTFNVYVAAAILFFEALASGLAISFISMQYWKKYENQVS